MSRICGFYKERGEVTEGSTLINDLMRPMLHSPLYESETASSIGCAFTHICHNSNHTSSYLHRKEPLGSYCLFNGYLSNLDEITQLLLGK